jgi:hypothetical protein
MTLLELALLVAALGAIVVVFAIELLRGKLPSFDKLGAPMLIAIRLFLGVIFAVLGVIGSFLPVLQGWLFFLIAFILLFPRNRFTIKAVHKLETKAPRLSTFLRRLGIGEHSDTIDAG